MNFKTLKVFERIQPNPNYKTVITVEQSEKNEDFFFITVSDWEKSPKGRQLWKQRGSYASIDFDKETMKEFGKFLQECGGS